MKARTPNFTGKYINNKTNTKKDIKKPHTPEIKNINNKYNKEIENKMNYINIKRASTAPHNNIHTKK